MNKLAFLVRGGGRLIKKFQLCRQIRFFRASYLLPSWCKRGSLISLDMKKLSLLIVALGLFSFSAFASYPPPYCTETWNYFSTAESSDPFEDAAIDNCCAGSNFTLNDLCGDDDVFIIITMNGPNSSCS